MASTNHVLLVLLFSFFLLNNHHAAARRIYTPIKNVPLINRVCQRTIYPYFCRLALNSNSRSATADVKGLAQIVLELTQIRVAKIRLQIQRTQPGNDPNIKNGLFACAQNYEVAEGIVRAAILRLNSNRFQEAAKQIQAAEVDEITCEGAFRPSPSPLTVNNNVFFRLVKTAEGIIPQI